MNKMLIGLLLVTSLALLLFSCETKDSDDKYPEIIVSQPLEGSIYANGDTIFLSVQGEAREGTHGWHDFHFRVCAYHR